MPLEFAFEPVVTQHRLRCGGKDVAYTATVSEVIQKDSADSPAATFYTFAYTLDGADPVTRPVVFVFNGGPGGSSLFFHLGGIGPVCAQIGESSASQHAPYLFAQNEHSLLDAADLVFIDPPGTGYARLLPGGKAEDFLGINQDAKAFGCLIRDWLARYQRWGSPKFLMGESYGTMRAAVLSRDLMGSYGTGALHGVSLNGLILLGQAVNLGSATPANGDLYFAMLLPTQAALAWHHGRTPRAGRTLAQVVEEAQAFVRTDYVHALFQGTDLPPDERERVGRRLAQLTGLPVAEWLAADLRIDASGFATSLLKSESKWISVYDGRFVLPKPAHASDPIADDPLLTHTAAAFVATLQSQLAGPMACPAAGDYVVINFKVNQSWDWRQSEVGPPIHLNAAPILAASMHRNPGLRLFVGSGAYDLATPLGSAHHMLTRGNFPLARVTHQVYESGHMPYIGSAALPMLSSDLRAFVRGSQGEQGAAK